MPPANSRACKSGAPAAGCNCGRGRGHLCALSTNRWFKSRYFIRGPGTEFRRDPHSSLALKRRLVAGSMTRRGSCCRRHNIASVNKL